EPSAERSSHGVASSFVRWTTWFVAGSIFRSSPCVASVTQTAPAVPATPHGLPPVAIFATTALAVGAAPEPAAHAPATRAAAGSRRNPRTGPTVGTARIAAQPLSGKEN